MLRSQGKQTDFLDSDSDLRVRYQKKFTLTPSFWNDLLVVVDCSVHLVELKDSGELYAMKAMEKSVMLNRNKVGTLKSQNFVCPNFSRFCLYFLRVFMFDEILDLLNKQLLISNGTILVLFVTIFLLPFLCLICEAASCELRVSNLFA